MRSLSFKNAMFFAVLALLISFLGSCVSSGVERVVQSVHPLQREGGRLPAQAADSVKDNLNFRVSFLGNKQFKLSWNAAAPNQLFEIQQSTDLVNASWEVLKFHPDVSLTEGETFETVVDGVGSKSFWRLRVYDLVEGAAQENVIIPQCAELGVGGENCEASIRFMPSQCLTDGGCSNLLLFFSGGQMSCPALDLSSNYLSSYAEDDYVAVCIKVFETAAENSKWPRLAIAPRVDLAIEALTGSSLVRKLWTGEHLLLSGVSEGATSPVVAMARSAYDENSYWSGSVKTAACFYDGIPDIQAHLNFIEKNNCFDTTELVECNKQITRYGCSDSAPNCNCDTVETQNDTIVNVPADNYSIKTWRIVSCGRAFRGTAACNNDATPESPLFSHCRNLNNGSDHSCSFQSLPFDSHLTCANTGVSKCKLWFDAL